MNASKLLHVAKREANLPLNPGFGVRYADTIQRCESVRLGTDHFRMHGEPFRCLDTSGDANAGAANARHCT